MSLSAAVRRFGAAWLIAVAAAGTVDAAPFDWTAESVQLVVKYQRNPLRAARSFAYLHVAMRDALVAAERSGAAAPLRTLASDAAAAHMLDFLYPQEPAGRFIALGEVARAAAPGDAAAKDRVWRLGESAARALIERARVDGAELTWNPADRPPIVPGGWRPAPPLNAYNPVEPTAPRWRTWVLSRPDEFAVPPPVAHGSEAYWQEAREVLEVSRRLTPEQKGIAERWNLDLGTVTPAGVWNLRARELIARHALDELPAAQVLAALNMAMLDAFVACWHVKLAYWTERPVTAIRATLDPAFMPYLVTPSFPGYVSGHATVSGAAAEVLAAVFPQDAAAARDWAEEAAMSRLYGGIHFRSDNDEGLRLGRRIGQAAAKQAFDRR